MCVVTVRLRQSDCSPRDGERVVHIGCCCCCGAYVYTVWFVIGFPSNCNNNNDNIYATETPSLIRFPVSGFNKHRLQRTYI